MLPNMIISPMSSGKAGMLEIKRHDPALARTRLDGRRVRHFYNLTHREKTMSIDYKPQSTEAVQLTQEQKDKLLEDWQAAKKAAKQWKEYEQQLRTYIVEHGGIFDKTKESGTENVELGNGYKLKAKKSISYKVENKKGEAIQMVQRLAALGEASAHKAKDLFRFDAELRISEYKKLDDAEKALVDEIITTKPGMPSLELVEPKS